MKRRFFLYGLLGWCLEVLWTGFLSALAGDLRFTATTYLWMFPVYGLAVLLEPVHDAMRPRPWWLRGLVWVILIWFIEISAGSLIRLITGAVPWDYTGETPWQVAGLIRLDMAPLWFAVGLLFERVHDYLARVVRI